MKTKAPINIPIKPHLKKFVLYMMNKREPLILDEKRLLGRVITAVLQERRIHKFENVLSSYTDRIAVVLNSDMRERSPRLDRLLYMNVGLAKLFREALLVWVKAQKNINLPAKQACINFLAELNIDDGEYSYDAAYKTWQRHLIEDRKP